MGEKHRTVHATAGADAECRAERNAMVATFDRHVAELTAKLDVVTGELVRLSDLAEGNAKVSNAALEEGVNLGTRMTELVRRTDSGLEVLAAQVVKTQAATETLALSELNRRRGRVDITAAMSPTLRRHPSLAAEDALVVCGVWRMPRDQVPEGMTWQWATKADRQPVWSGSMACHDCLKRNACEPDDICKRPKYIPLVSAVDPTVPVPGGKS